MFEDAARLIVQNQLGSTSLIQRRMKLGYNRAGRIMEQMEAVGIVGPSQGSKPREVYVKTEIDLIELLSKF
jgi:DNA segregation ATPase FtsK/SpoIIIE, S-DNA-T family